MSVAAVAGLVAACMSDAVAAADRSAPSATVLGRTSTAAGRLLAAVGDDSTARP